MMDAVTVGELLKDFRSIKLSPNTRAMIDSCRELLEAHGALPSDKRFAVMELAKRYNKQFAELYAARARARRTNGLRAAGISREDAARLVEERKKNEELRKSDVGF